MQEVKERDKKAKVLEIPEEVREIIAQVYRHLRDQDGEQAFIDVDNIEALVHFFKHHHPEPYLIETDTEGIITYVNDAFARQTGYTKEELIGQPARILRSSRTPAGIFQQMWGAIQKGKAWHDEFENRRKDYTTFWVHMLVLPITDANGKPKKYLGVAFDVTELYEQRFELERKNQEMRDSIRYAKRIQKNFLPPDELFQEMCDDFFIMYRPKDVVSGDFYWAYATIDKFFVAVVDCTGHGVPGAFMSIIGYNLLNNIVIQDKVYAPGAVLTELHRRLRETLKQDKEDSLRDGMDLVFVTIERYGDTIYYAGANNHLYWWRENLQELEVVKADKKPIGGEQMEEERVFTTKTLEVSEGDVIYMTTDGFIDQLGGPKEKKFGSKRFKELIRKYHAEPLKRQRALFNQEWRDWKQDLEQIDDVTMIAIRFGELSSE